MSAAEVAAFLAGERTATCATLGRRGWPHLMPLWYVLRPIPAGDAAVLEPKDARAAVHAAVARLRAAGAPAPPRARARSGKAKKLLTAR